jgi:hypothetical protein
MNIDSNTFDAKLEDLILHIYSNVIINWDEICKDVNIIKSLDMNTNELCKKYKLEYKDMKDELIQAYVLTSLIMINIIMTNIIINKPIVMKKDIFLD